ncbi:aminoglycoside 6'-N-acetyltransferase [Spirosoma sp. KNUC1025]|uniref:aminoglycoside 6'-N-acetyltransferase n=1 Tax=Spirosoma sp. KNUC1025 TaxID=2894082 RepID=UPI00386F9D2C|nr:GNAT family N-acetyltransferase [Spirosoma sp. KNUC1025]
MQLEKLSEGNIDAFVQLVLELWPDCTFDEEYEYYGQLMSAENHCCYLASNGNKYVAFIHLTLRTDYVEGADTSPVAYVEGLYVTPAYQQQGLAKKLMGVGEEWGREKGCKELASDTELSNSASIDFHKGFGFREANRVVCFIKEL